MKNKLLEKGVSVECKTAEEVKKVLKICKDINIKWVDGQIQNITQGMRIILKF